MKKQNIAIIGVIAFVLAVAVGYALFSQTLTINGTATAKGSFDVVFQLTNDEKDTKLTYDPTCNAGYKYCTANKYDLEAVVQEDDETGEKTAVAVVDKAAGSHNLTVTVNKLTYPGATITIPFRVKNIGSIDAKLVSINQTGTDGNGKAENATMSIVYEGPATTDEVLASQAYKDGKIVITWPDTDKSNSVDEKLTFTVTLVYQQAA